jgi:hypothetical protein
MEMNTSLHRLLEAIDVDTFIERADEIIGKAKRHPAGINAAREEADILLTQFEEYLKSKGL